MDEEQPPFEGQLDEDMLDLDEHELLDDEDNDEDIEDAADFDEDGPWGAQHDDIEGMDPPEPEDQAVPVEDAQPAAERERQLRQLRLWNLRGHIAGMCAFSSCPARSFVGTNRSDSWRVLSPPRGSSSATVLSNSSAQPLLDAWLSCVPTRALCACESFRQR